MIIEPDLSSQDLTHGELRERSARFEATLSDLGVEALATLTGKSTELMVASGAEGGPDPTVYRVRTSRKGRDARVPRDATFGARSKAPRRR